MFPPHVGRSSSPQEPSKAQKKKSDSVKSRSPSFMGRAFTKVKSASSRALQKIGSLFSREVRERVQSTPALTRASSHFRNVLQKPHSRSVGAISSVSAKFFRDMSSGSSSQSSVNSRGSPSSAPTSSTSLRSRSSESPPSIGKGNQVEGDSTQSVVSSKKKTSDSFSMKEKKYLNHARVGGPKVLGQVRLLKERVQGRAAAQSRDLEKLVETYIQIPTQENLNEIEDLLKTMKEDPAFQGKLFKIEKEVSSIRDFIPNAKGVNPRQETASVRDSSGNGASRSSTPKAASPQPSAHTTPENTPTVKQINDQLEFKILVDTIHKSLLAIKALGNINFLQNANESPDQIDPKVLSDIKNLKDELSAPFDFSDPRAVDQRNSKITQLVDLLSGLSSSSSTQVQRKMSSLLKELKDLQATLSSLAKFLKSPIDLDALSKTKPLASGGTASVYVSPRFPNHVVKVFEDHVSDAEIANLVGEGGREVARRLMILDHPNLVPIYDITYNSDGKPKTIEMPLVKGTALFNKEEFIKGIESDSQKWAIAKQVCSGLNHMHENNLVHRDVQAKNVIVNEQGNVFLCDMDSAFLEGMAIEKAPDYLIPPELRFTKEEQRRIIEENRKATEGVISLTEIEYPKGPVTEKFDSWQYGLFLADLFLDGTIGENSELDLPLCCMTFMKDEKLQNEYEGNLGSYLCSEFNIENPLENMLIGLLHFDPTTRLSLSNLRIS